jgi:hypothetical protein
VSPKGPPRGSLAGVATRHVTAITQGISIVRIPDPRRLDRVRIPVRIPDPRRPAPTGEQIIESTYRFVLDLLESVQAGPGLGLRVRVHAQLTSASISYCIHLFLRVSSPPMRIATPRTSDRYMSPRSAMGSDKLPM